LILRYFLSPNKVIDPYKVEFSVTQLEGESGKQKCIIPSPAQTITLKSDLWMKSVGYKTIPMPGVPFDTKTFTIPNDMGCVQSK